MKHLVLIITLMFGVVSYTSDYKFKARTGDRVEILESKVVEQLEVRDHKKEMADSIGLILLDNYQREKTLAEHRDFKNKLRGISDSLDIHFSWLAQVMWHESRINSKALNSIKAAGLIQFLPRTAKGLGTSTKELLTMSSVEQLDYVYKYFKPVQGKIKDVSDLYLYTFFPIAVIQDWDDDHVIEYKSLTAAKIARANRGLDLDKNGVITVKEFRTATLKYCPKEINAYKNIV